MPSCAICKKSVTSGVVLCGHCAKGLAPYTLPADLAWFIDRPQRCQGVAAEAGGAILPRKGSVTEVCDARKHLIKALDRVSLSRGA